MKKLIVIFLSSLLLISCSSNSDMEFITIRTTEAETKEDPVENESKSVVNVAFASVVSPKETRSKYIELVNYLEDKLDISIQIVQKQSYDEVNQLIKSGEVDLAFICSLSYVLGREENYMEGIVTPVVKGEDKYRSYVIVNKNSKITHVEELRNKRFAYTDPYSYTGKLAMIKLLYDKGYNSDAYFDETFYTYSHDYSVSAVARGAVDGATVDSMLYDLLLELENEDVLQTKIIYKGEYAGAPPVVVSNKVDKGLKENIRNEMIHLNESKEGKEILESIQIDSYAPLQEENYNPINEALRSLGGIK